MWHWGLGVVALAWIVLAAASATAGMPYNEPMKCPIGGESFEHTTTASYTIFGQRPDGKPYGSWHFPLDLPRCPGNGLIVFDKFSAADLERLTPLIASAEYRAMLPVETDYFLAAWLMEKLGRDPLDVAWMVVQASWQADGKPALKTRYQSDYVERIRAVERKDDEFLWLVMQGRAVNGLRELGRFDEARTLLASLPVKSLDVAIPKERKDASASEGGDTVLNREEIDAAESKRSFFQYFGTLEDLIRRRIAASDPLQMMPKRDAAMKCREGRASLSREDRDYCASDAMKKFRSGDD
jgi:hypothetical protein